MSASPELELERRAHRLRGEVLRAVRYQRGEELGEIDSVEHLAFLDFDSGLRVAVGCTDELGYRHGFGVSVRPQKVIDTAYGEPLDVSASAGKWAPRIGRVIDRAMIHWDDVFERLRPSLSIGVAIHADHLSRLDYPSTLELGLGDLSVYFCAARPSEKGAVGFVNELIVMFSAETRDALGVR